MTMYGYARVSTDGQTLAAQRWRGQGLSEKVSGASTTNRPQLRKALAALGEGDVLVVTRLDRLAPASHN
jgi:DNA invertase Pin-like site-specific DNA recombinase